MAINLDTRVSGVARNEGFGNTIDAAPFVNAFNSQIRAGQQLQALGQRGSDFALAEQKLYNATQTDLLNIERKTTMNEFVNNTRNTKRRENLENDYRSGYDRINKDIIKKAPNDRIKALVAAEGNSYFASNFPSIQKEARVYRLNAQKTQVLDRVRALRIELTQTDDLLRKQELYKDINKLLIGGQDQGSLDPDEVSKELFEVAQIEESARLTKLLFQAETETEVDKILATAKYMDDPQAKALLEIRAYGWVGAKRRANITAQDRAERIKIRELKTRQEAYERDISARLYAPEDADIQWSPVTMEELIEKLEDGNITQSYFNRREEQISQGFVFKNRQTDPSELLRISDLVEKQLKDPYGEHIGIDDIELNHLLSNEHRSLMTQRLLTGKRSEADNAQTKYRKMLRQSLNVDAFVKMNKMTIVEAKNRTLYEYELRTNPLFGGKENPVDVFNEMMGKELNIDGPTHQTNKLIFQGLKDRIDPQFRVFVDGMDKDTGKVPNIAAMKDKIKAAVAGGTLDFEDAIEMTDVLKQMEAMGWDAETIEKLGGIKSKKTLNAEKKEKERQEKEDERLKAQELETLKQQKADDLAEEKARIAQEEADAKEAVRHQREMEARKVVEQQEREKLAGKKEQDRIAKLVKQWATDIREEVKAFENIDPDEMVKLIEPLFQEMGGFEAINQMLGQATKERTEERAEEQATLQAQHERVVGRVEAEQAGKARRAADAAQQESEAKVLAQRAKYKRYAESKGVKATTPITQGQRRIMRTDGITNSRQEVADSLMKHPLEALLEDGVREDIERLYRSEGLEILDWVISQKQKVKEQGATPEIKKTTAEARIAKEKAAQERKAQQKSEAKVLARRAAEEKAAKVKAADEKRKVVKLKRLQQEAQDKKDFAALAEIEKALAKQTTGLGNQTKYPNKLLLKRLQDLQSRNFDAIKGYGRKLGPIEIKEMETIEKEIKNRKLTPLPLG